MNQNLNISMKKIEIFEIDHEIHKLLFKSYIENIDMKY